MSSQFIYRCEFFGCGREIIKQKGGRPPKYCLEHHHEIVKIRRRMEMRKRRHSMVGIKCHRCKGRITRLHKKFYCSDYCAWLAGMVKKNKRFAARMKEFELTKMLKVENRQLEKEIVAQ